MARKKWKSKGGKCIYCGRFAQHLTEDHVPPKCLFAEPRPTNLITVPCCGDCNESASKDDEYFRLCLSMSNFTKGHTEVKRLMPAVWRSLERSDKSGFTRSFLNAIKYMNARSPSGLYLGAKPAQVVDIVRLNRVVERTVRGIYYHDNNERIPDQYVPKSISIESEMQTWSFEQRREIEVEFLQPLLDIPPIMIGDHVFQYHVQYFDEDRFVTAWLLTFYNTVHFLCLFAPINKAMY